MWRSRFWFRKRSKRTPYTSLTRINRITLVRKWTVGAMLITGLRSRLNRLNPTNAIWGESTFWGELRMNHVKHTIATWKLEDIVLINDQTRGTLPKMERRRLCCWGLEQPEWLRGDSEFRPERLNYFLFPSFFFSVQFNSIHMDFFQELGREVPIFIV